MSQDEETSASTGTDGTDDLASIGRAQSVGALPGTGSIRALHSPPPPVWHPILLEPPHHLTDVSSWHGHIPFAFWCVATLRPRVFVELGTHKGDSYAAFCQAIDHLSLDTACFAVDTWRGDDHAGLYDDSVYAALARYHDARYRCFSQLLRTTFDEAAAYFPDQKIDLLHIDGLHTYEAVRHDFETWLPKLSDRAVVLFHDINVRENGFGVWRFWEEVSQRYPHFSFTHSHGLGVLAVGPYVPDSFGTLFEHEGPSAETVRSLFSRLGEKIWTLGQALERERQLQSLHESEKALHNEASERIRVLEDQIGQALERERQLQSLHESEKALHNEASERIRVLEDQLAHVVPIALNALGIKELPALLESWRSSRTWRLGRRLSRFSHSKTDAMFDRALVLARDIVAHADEPAISLSETLRELEVLVASLGASRAFHAARLLSASARLGRLRSPSWGSFEHTTAVLHAARRAAVIVPSSLVQWPETVRAKFPVTRNSNVAAVSAATLLRERAATSNAGRVGVFLFFNQEASLDAAENTIEGILAGTFTNVTIEVQTTQRLGAWPAGTVIRRDQPITFADIIKADYKYIVFIDAGDRLDPSFLGRCISALSALEDLGGAYSDYSIGSETVHLPKWDHVWIQYENYIAAPVLWKTELLAEIMPAVKETDIIGGAVSINWAFLKAAGRNRVVHVPGPLVKTSARTSQICEHKLPAVVPSVSIIIPTNGSNVGLLKTCLQSIFAKTRYAGPYEVILMDNSRGKASTAFYDYISDISRNSAVRCVDANIPFNWSALNNLGVQNSASEVFVFLNDDTEVIAENWLTALVDPLRLPTVGAVGAQLLFPDGTVQHAGVTLVPMGGGAVHIGYKNPPEMLGRWNRAPRSVAAVTGACVAVKRKAYDDARGFPEAYQVISSDIAFCLAVRQAGYECVYNPLSLLYHHEMVSRKVPDFPDDTKLFWEEWGDTLGRDDPYYPNVFRKLPADFEMNEESPSQVMVLDSPFIDRAAIRNVLIVKLDHLGDIFLTKEAILRIKQNMPLARLHVLCGSWSRTLFESMGVDNIVPLDLFSAKSDLPLRRMDAAEVSQLRRTLITLHIDVAIDLRRHPETRWILGLSGALMTVGYETPTVRPHINIPSDHVVADNPEIPFGKPHIRQQMLSLVDRIPILDSVGVVPEPPVDRAQTLIIGLHPGCGSDSRQWGVDYYADLACIALGRGWQVRLYGGERERGLNRAIMKATAAYKGVIEDWTGRLPIEEFGTRVSEQCCVFVGNNSGATHMVAATGLPVVAVFGGFVDPYEWFPPGINTKVLVHDMQCAPCYKGRKEDCGFERACLRGISPQNVMDEVEKSIRRGRWSHN